MTTAEHDRNARHHRAEAEVHEIAASLADERGDTLGAEEHRDAVAFHLGEARRHETAGVHARLTSAGAIAANAPTHEAAFT